MQESEEHSQGQNVHSDTLEARLGPAGEQAQASAPTEACLRSLFHSTTIGIARVTRRIFQDVNDRLCEIVGYPREELVGQDARLLYLSDDDYNEVGRRSYRPIAEYGTIETRWRRKDGHIINVLLTSTPLDPSDLSKGVMFTILDITARKTAEDELQSIFDLSLDMVCIADINTATFVKVNPAFEHTLGYTQEELLERPFLDFIHPDDTNKTVGIIQEKLQKGERVINFENRYRCKDGTYRWINWTSHPRPEQGLTYAVARDTTKRREAKEALKKSEQRYRAIVEDQTEFICRFQPDGCVTFVNEAMCRFYSQLRADLIGRNFGAWMVPEEHVELWRNLKKLTPEHPVATYENRIIVPGGQDVWGQWTNRAIFDEQGQIIEYQAVGRNITEQKKAERAIRESEQRFRTLFEGANDAIFVMQDDRFLDCNSMTLELFACTREDILGHRPDEFSPPTQPDGSSSVAKAAEHLRAVAAGTAQRFEWQHRRLDGTLFDAEVSLNILALPDGQYVQAIVRNVTGRKQAEEALRDNERFLTDVFDGIQDGISVLDIDLNIVRANRWMQKKYAEQAPLVGKKCYEVYQQRQTPCPWCPALITLETGVPHTRTVPYPSEQDPTGWIELSTFPLKDASNQVCGIIGHVRDITERKQAEAKMARLTAIIEATSDLVSTATSDGQITYLNRAARAMLGLSEGDAADSYRIQDVHTDSAFRLIKEEGLPQATQNGAWSGETTLRGPNGKEIPVSQVITSHWAKDGTLEYFSAIMRDLTEQKAAETALRESETRFRELAEMLPQTVFEMDAAGRFTFANHAGLEAFGYCREELYNLNVCELFVAEERERITEAIHKRLRGDLVTNQEYQAMRKEGRTFPILLYASPILRDGVPIGLRGIGLDISERKQAEEQRKARLHALESMERINGIIREATDPEQMLGDVIETVREIFDCDRAWLLHPCDPDAPSFRVPVESTTPDYPGASVLYDTLPNTPSLAQDMRIALDAEGPVWHTVGTEHPMPEEMLSGHGVQSRLITPVYPKVGQPWMFGLHQCSYPRPWTAEEQQLFKEISHRLADGLSSLLSLRNLQESEGRFRELAELLPQVVFETDADGQLSFVNHLACDAFGYEPEEFHTLQIIDLFASADRQRMEQNLRKHLDGTLFWDHEYAAQRKDGTQFPVLLYSAPVYRDELVVGLRGIVVDITERRFAEQALQESKAKLEGILESSPNAICVTDLKGNILDCNQATLDMYGYEGKDALVGHNMLTFVAEEDRARAQVNLEITQTQGLTANVEFAVLKPDGRVFPCEVSTSLMKNPCGQPMGLVASMADITERKQAQKALRKSEQKYRSLIANIPDVIWTCDEHGRTTFMSPNIERVCGYCPTDICGQPNQPWFNRIHPDDLQRVREAEDRLFRAGTPLDVNYRFKTKDGRWIWLQDRSTGTYEKEGVRYADGVFIDVTERQRLEQALEERLVALTRPLDDAAGVEFEELFDLEEIQKLQGLFADATGVASIITRPDGSPITKPSNFCRLCANIIRKTPQGLKNCYYSDSIIGNHNPEGPTVQPCLSGGLWDAGASITVGGRHIANWLIGQVRNQAQDETKMKAYAQQIGADIEAFMNAFHEVPTMPKEQFERVADALFAIADRLSAMAYQNVQQARFIAERKRSEQALQESERKLATLMANLPGMAYRCRADDDWTMEFASEGCTDVTGYPSDDIIDNRKCPYNDIVHPEDRRYLHEYIEKALAKRRTFELEYRIVTAQNEERWVWERGRQVSETNAGIPILEGLILDVSERRNAEQKLKAYQQKLKSLALELSLAEERERRRIATGLHDDACQNLVLSKMQLQGLRPSLSADSAPTVEAVCQSLNHTLESIRELTFDLSSPILYRFGLAAALEELLKDKLRNHPQIHYQFTNDGQSKHLSDDVLVLLFQSVRELLINVIKHAQAHKVSLDIRRQKDSIRIVLTDDGIGFDVEEVLSFPSQKRSVGLFNILERLDYIGGKLEVESHVGHGSRFTLTAPLTTEMNVAKEFHDGSENSAR